MDPLAAVGIVLSALAVLFLALSYQVYRRAFVPARPMWLDDFSFTPFEFQADYEEVELVTADGINFGAWHFRQPGSPQTVIVSGGHKGQRQGALGIAVALWRKGFNVILYSYRGMPGSDSRASASPTRGSGCWATRWARSFPSSAPPASPECRHWCSTARSATCASC
ncbi:MAG: hypothetical protein E6I29_01370 [Chloroflexi bacterium]|nr:MAG: hypothetical protein E6I29_01370 [Chloroflexota bacterium]